MKEFYFISQFYMIENLISLGFGLLFGQNNLYEDFILGTCNSNYSYLNAFILNVDVYSNIL